MPGWLINIIISLVVKFGLPYALDWLKRRFPWLDLGQVSVIMNDHVSEMKDLKKSQRAVKAKTKQRLRDQCSGVACPPELKV